MFDFKEKGIPIEILLVEDNEGDIVLTKEAFKESKLHNNLSIVKDGVEALSFLSSLWFSFDVIRFCQLRPFKLNPPYNSFFEMLLENWSILYSSYSR